MDRRTALRNLTLGFGYTVAAPTIMSIFSSCTEDVETWKPVFFSKKEKNIVTHLVDIIFPSSEIPGALDVNIPQFIDMMYHEIETDPKKSQFKKGATIFAANLENKFGGKAEKSSKEEVEELFSSYFDVAESDVEKILTEQNLPEQDISNEKLDDYQLYKFLISVRHYTIFGYFTSEKTGKEVLNYDPVPMKFEGCVPLKDMGNQWTL